MYPPAHPTSHSGQLESEINSIKSILGGKANDYDVRQALGRLDSLEHTVREISTSLDGLRSQLQAIQEGLRVAVEN